LKSFYYELVPSAFGTLSVIWQKAEEKPKVYRIFLPDEEIPMEDVPGRTFVDVRPVSCPNIVELGKQIQSFLEGKTVNFELSIIALEECSEFQRTVLVAEHRIPRGWVSTYGRIARSLGMPTGARIVGRALSQNPFPIIIPCHRAIRANGELGGFQGGLRMKRALLEFEGVEFSPFGRVITNRIYY
jgi:methylated-DNA-[protein]-cysteine S-methyltransferase